MPPKAIKRKAGNSQTPATSNSRKAPRVGTSTDAPASAKQNKGESLIFTMLTYNHITIPENAEPTRRAVRSNRGQGGHAFQLEKVENAIKSNPSRTYGKSQRNKLIPDIPENAMAPSQPRKGGNNKVNQFFIWWQRVHDSFGRMSSQDLPIPLCSLSSNHFRQRPQDRYFRQLHQTPGLVIAQASIAARVEIGNQIHSIRLQVSSKFLTGLG
jgi:hypothetical protein